MMDIPAQLVKQLRDKTGVSFMRCKKALAASDADLDKAVEWLRQQGEGVAAGKSSRTAAEGAVLWHKSPDVCVLLEVNCETDSVARLDDFVEFGQQLLEALAAKQPADVESLMQLSLDGTSFEQRREEMVGRIGENIQVRRFLLFTDKTDRYHAYIHGGHLAGVVCLNVANDALGHDMAMQVVASQSAYISLDDIPESIRVSEREIIAAGLADSKKPENIRIRIVEGKLNKQLGAMVLEQQPFLKDNQQLVAAVLKQHDAKIEEMHLWRCGEGIEKPVSDFASEVQQQAAQAQSADAKQA